MSANDDAVEMPEAESQTSRRKLIAWVTLAPLALLMSACDDDGHRRRRGSRRRRR